MKTVRVWDLPLRLFHWSLMLLVIAAVVFVNIGGNMMVWHARCGYAVITLILFRIVWGLAGPLYARFSTFLAGPGDIVAWLRGLKSSEPKRLLGHNPLGALSVLIMLAVLLMQAGSGLFANDAIAFEGPLARLVSMEVSERMTWFHTEISVKLVFFFLGLHVLAIFFYLLVKRKNLITPMLTGDVQSKVDAPAAIDTPAMWLRALLILAVCGAGVFWLVNL